jgi:hypothetical protein
MFYCGFLCDYNFWDSPFYSCHNAQILFFFGLIGFNVFMDFFVNFFLA